MTEPKRVRPAARAEWNQQELCHWLRLVDLAEAAAMIEAFAGAVEEARGVAITLWTALEVLRRRGLDPEVQDIFTRTASCRPSWLTLPPWPKETP